MRLLWLSHVVPYPPTAGVLLRAYNLLKGVSSGNEIDLIAFVQKPLLRPVYPDIGLGLEKCRKALLEFCNQVTFLPIDKSDRPFGRLRSATESLFSGYGYVGSWLYSDSARDAIAAATADRRYDAIHFDSISLLRYRDLFSGIPASLGHHNAESQMLLRRSKNEHNPLLKTFYRLEASKVGRLESIAARQFQLHFTCSELDSERLKETMPDARSVPIPNGVDIDYFKPMNLPERANSLVFVGTMNWYPNVHAMTYFLQDIWPSLLNAVPSITLDIIGANAPRSLVDLSRTRPGVTLHGFVNDIRPLVDSASLYVCPITDGGGTKLKILDALAMAKCVVAHPIACEGLNVTNGRSIQFAESRSDFVNQISYLLESPAIRREIGASARHLVVQEYSFSRIANEMRKHLEAIIL